MRKMTDKQVQKFVGKTLMYEYTWTDYKYDDTLERGPHSRNGKFRIEKAMADRYTDFILLWRDPEKRSEEQLTQATAQELLECGYSQETGWDELLGYYTREWVLE